MPCSRTMITSVLLKDQTSVLLKDNENKCLAKRSMRTSVFLGYNERKYPAQGQLIRVYCSRTMRTSVLVGYKENMCTAQGHL